MTQKRKVYKRKRKHKRKKFRNHQQRRVFVMTAARKCQKQRLKKARVRMRPFSKKCHVARLRPRYGRFMSKKRQPVNDVPCQFSHTGPSCKEDTEEDPIPPKNADKNVSDNKDLLTFSKTPSNNGSEHNHREN